MIEMNQGRILKVVGLNIYDKVAYCDLHMKSAEKSTLHFKLVLTLKSL